MKYEDLTEEGKKAWWAAYPAIPDWSEAEESCLVRFLRDADLEGEIRLTGPTSAAQWAYVNMWMNKAGPGLGYNRTYTVSSIRERYINHILPRLKIQPLPKRKHIEYPSQPTSATSQMARKPLNADTYSPQAKPRLVEGPTRTLNVSHLTTGTAGMPDYRAIANISMPSRATGSSRHSSSSAGPSVAANILKTYAIDGGIYDQSISTTERAALEEADEAAHALIMLSSEPTEFPHYEPKE